MSSKVNGPLCKRRLLPIVVVLTIAIGLSAYGLGCLRSTQAPGIRRIATINFVADQLLQTNEKQQLVCCGSIGEDGMVAVDLATGTTESIKCDSTNRFVAADAHMTMNMARARCFFAAAVDATTNVVWACNRTGQLYTWRPDSDTAKFQIDLTEDAWLMSQAGENLIVFCHHWQRPSERGKLFVVNMKSKKVTSYDSPHPNGVACMAVIGNQLVTAGKDDGKIAVSLINDSMKLKQMSHCGDGIARLSGHYESRLAISFWGSGVQLRDLNDLSQIRAEWADACGSQGLFFSPNGSKLFAHSLKRIYAMDVDGLKKTGAAMKLNSKDLESMFAAIAIDDYVIVAADASLYRIDVPQAVQRE